MSLVRSTSRRIARPLTRGLTGLPLRAAVIAALFGDGEQGALYDPSDLSTLFQDSAGTTPVTADGQPVGRMEDLSGNGNHATQATADRRPIYRTAGGLHWLEFDGVVANLYTTFPATQNSLIISAAVKHFGGTGGQHIYDMQGATTTPRTVLRAVAEDHFWRDDAGSNSAPGAGVVGSDSTIYSFVSNQSTRALAPFRNGIELASVTNGGSDWPTLSNIRLGARIAAQDQSESDVFGLAFSFGSAEMQRRQLLEQWLASKSGITL